MPSGCLVRSPLIQHYRLSATNTNVDTAYHLASAAVSILRCAIKFTNDNTARECVSSARALVKHLRAAKDDSNWDLGDVCLSQCEKIVNDSSIDRIVTRPQHPTTSRPEHEHDEASVGMSSHREDRTRPSNLKRVECNVPKRPQWQKMQIPYHQLHSIVRLGNMI